MLGNYLQQMTLEDVIFQMHFFLGALRVKLIDLKKYSQLHAKPFVFGKSLNKYFYKQ